MKSEKFHEVRNILVRNGVRRSFRKNVGKTILIHRAGMVYDLDQHYMLLDYNEELQFSPPILAEIVPTDGVNLVEEGNGMPHYIQAEWCVKILTQDWRKNITDPKYHNRRLELNTVVGLGWEDKVGYEKAPADGSWNFIDAANKADIWTLSNLQKTFTTTDSVQKKHNGKQFTLLGRTPGSEYDRIEPEAGSMWRIMLDDECATTLDVWGDEIAGD